MEPTNKRRLTIVIGVAAVLVVASMLLGIPNPPTGQVVLNDRIEFSATAEDADINQDGEVDIFDMVNVIQNKGKTNFEPRTDINSDGKVDDNDVEIVRGFLGNTV